MSGSASHLLFLALVGAIALERVVELALSISNARWARAHGGVEAESGRFYATLVVFHVLFLVAAPAEVFLLARPFVPAIGVTCGVLLALAMALRYWAIATLGRRWNTRVIVIPGLAPIATGPYRYVRHPNYVAVVVEAAALPLFHGALLTAGAALVANAFLLAARIRHEEAALEEAGGYAERFAGRPRFLPKGATR